jgi:hypothetical protein
VQQSGHATLKATGEPVVILGQSAGFDGQQCYLVRLPPQQTWHKPRFQDIRGDRLQFSNR